VIARKKGDEWFIVGCDTYCTCEIIYIRHSWI
jgi:hypothetical protein